MTLLKAIVSVAPSNVNRLLISIVLKVSANVDVSGVCVSMLHVFASVVSVSKLPISDGENVPLKDKLPSHFDVDAKPCAKITASIVPFAMLIFPGSVAGVTVS